VVWLVCSLFGLAGVIAYAASWIVIPEEPYLLAERAAAPDRAVT
jgi:phage shock protein PspC (stress-responsive transcriptional regulator)